MPRVEKEGKETLPAKSWIIREYEAATRKVELEAEIRAAELEEKVRRLQRQERTLTILIVIFAAAILMTISLIFLDGFNIWGFNLETSTLNLLVGATIAEVAGLLAIALQGLYRIRKE